MAPSMMGRCVDAALASLQDAEQQAKSGARRQQLADAAAALGRQRAALCSGYAARVDTAIQDALRSASGQIGQLGQPGGAAKPQRPAPESADFELTLIEDEEVARFVEASRLQQTAMPVVEEVLTRLDSLMSSALGLPVVRADLNPLRPDVLCAALLELVESLPEPPAARSQWVRHMAKTFARELKALYESVAKQLQAQGVEEARYRLKLTEGGLPPAAKTASAPAANAPGGQPSGGASGRAAGMGGMGSSGSMNSASAPPLRMGDLARAQPAVAPALMRDFLYRPQWVAEHDEPLPPAYYEAVQKQMAREAQRTQASYDEAAHARLLAQARALSAVDRPARAVDVGTALSPKQWGEQASPAYRTQTLMQLKRQASKMSQAIGLSAVRTLVNQVASDERVLAPVREAFVALEPALLRMAMADPRFFGDDNHPARRLVENVAQRSFKYNNEFDTAFEQFMEPVREAVRSLNRRPEASVKAFNDQLQALQTRWQAEDAGDQQQQDAGLRSMHFAQERQALADKIARDFSLRSDLDGVPAIVADFLFDVWSLVIAHAQLTDTRRQLDPGGYLAVVTDLLWSVKREQVLHEPARLFEVLPGLLQTLRRGLDMLGKDPQEVRPFFDALMHVHNPVLRLRRLRSVRDAEASGLAPRLDPALIPTLPDEPLHIPSQRPQPKPKADAQPWLGRHELAAAGFEDGIEATALDMTPDEVDRMLASQADFAPTQPQPRPEADTPHPDAAANTTPATPPANISPANTAATGAPPPPASPAPADKPRAPATPGQPAPPAPSSPPAAIAPAPAAAPAPASDEDETSALIRSQLERLRKGDWVDLYVHGQWRRAQTSWVSDNGSLFMFVSRGGRPHSMTRRTCEKLLRKRHLRPVNTAAVVDQALQRLPQERPTAPDSADDPLPV